MTTLIAVYNSEGCVGRCDARCYEARNAKCHCICGGRNHSAGKQRAIENVREGVGMSGDDLLRFVQGREPLRKQWGGLTVIDRLTTPKAKSARHEAHMKINQPSLFAMLNQPGPIGIDRTPMSWWKDPHGGGEAA
jgi:hypothetical protein